MHVITIPRVVLQLILSFNLLTHLAHAVGPYKSLGDLWSGELSDVSAEAPYGNPYLGGQSYYHCCLRAINESLEIVDGEAAFRPGQTSLRGSISTLLSHQFPCGASYNGSEGDQPQVWTSYSWCHKNCPGWTLTQPSWIESYAKPLIAFICPSLIFCLNMPRRRRLDVPESLFPRRPTTPVDFLKLLYKIPAAYFIVTLDTVIWLIVAFAISGPMLLSGLYEAFIDAQLLDYLDERLKANKTTVQERAHLLFVILLGNLDHDPAWIHTHRLVSRLPDTSIRQLSRATSTDPNAPSTPVSSNTVTADGSDLTADDTSSTTGSAPKPALAGHFPVTHYSIGTRLHIQNVKVKLRAMLDSQYSFGTTVGAAIVFYTGSFVYTLIEIQAHYGNSGTAHQLAFGNLWMTIPHIAIASSLLLAGNNPSVWEAARTLDDLHEHTTELSQATQATNAGAVALTGGDKDASWRSPIKALSLTYRAMYRSKYKPAWLWNRGLSKAQWVAEYVKVHPNLERLHEEVLGVGIAGWNVHVCLTAVFLVLVPAFLGGMVSYTTPVIGLSCRSMTILVYASSQIVLIVLWLCNWRYWQRDAEGRIKCLGQPGGMYGWKDTVWYTVFAIAITAAVFTSLGGTVFVLINLYGNCLCFIPIWYWSSRYTSPNAVLYWSDNSSEQIYYAKRFWFPTGIAATAFLVAVTYLGWWYQRNLRGRFRALASKIDYVDQVDLQEAEKVDHRVSVNPTHCRM